MKKRHNNSVLSWNELVGSGERKVLGVVWDLATTDQLIVNQDKTTFAL